MPVCNRTTQTGLTAQVHRNWMSLEPLIPDWEALLGEADYPTVFSTYEFCRLGWETFHRHESSLFVVTLHAAERLVAVVPMRLEPTRVAGIGHTVLLPVHLREVDKPYPVIAESFLAQAWTEIVRVLMAHSVEWDILHWPELPDDLSALQLLREAFAAEPRVRFETRADAAGPLVDLQQDWPAFTARHRRFRRALRRIHKQCEEEVHLELYSEPEQIEEALGLYVEVEKRSWKAGKIGVARDARALQFYQSLSMQLARRGRIVIAILFDGNKPISAEIAYTCVGRVFFSHGTFDSEYAALSPGKISTGLFVGSFLQGQYQWGDFLAGFADYLTPWSDKTLSTTEVFVYQKRPGVMALWAWRRLGLRKRLAGWRKRLRARAAAR